MSKNTKSWSSLHSTQNDKNYFVKNIHNACKWPRLAPAGRAKETDRDAHRQKM